MVRFLGALVGLFFSGMLLLSFLWGAVAYVSAPPEPTAETEFHEHPRKAGFSFTGPFGHYDRAQLQRGFQVYTEVCSACHSLHQVAFRSLSDLGYNEAEIKAIAKARQVPSIDPNTGEAATREGMPADKFPLVYPNEVAARAANNNAIPPDLSLIAKARHDGANYVYSLLTGYQAQPAELLRKFPDSKTGEGLHYNPYFANLNLAMAPPLTAEGQVTYGEGQPRPTVDQMAKDVSAFLMWAAEPKMEARKSTGIAVLVFLIFATVLAYMSYQNIWANKEH
ncbi:ubiquinol-cytochrome c reductase cytochrome c1 subunit [Sphingobium sp. SYK-6]|uniref:cytochrome c1 n=1 Tax=Sphingobium sp. (strain NBRC 103272 / SYK-6) TaxID=627192 RepID=UPI00022779F9|nr:cytochrome c1 [Sphingobium sp. SYK-6]BAK68101.1 ubiquinol-cytochrome c reductase cytochrome c1 subunit [Sphingobium sp. SYK-6]